MTTVRGEIKSDLGKKLQAYRTDRPDEWTMDEFTREAEKMQARIVELEGHNAALAHELRRLSGTCAEPDVESIDRVLAEAAEAAKEAT